MAIRYPKQGDVAFLDAKEALAIEALREYQHQIVPNDEEIHLTLTH